MPNQLNFPDKLPSALNQRPSRISARDSQLFQSDLKQILFGTNINDLIEIWIYNSDGSIAGHVNVPVTSADITISSVMDNTGAYEFLNIDLGNIARQTGVEQGRYALVINFFRDEVGSETGQKLFIQDISPDRTELQLHPVSVTDDILHDIFEWVTPSVPRIDAEALIDQLFGKNINPDMSQTLTVDKIETASDVLTNGNTTSRLAYSEATIPYEAVLNMMINDIYTATLNNLANDASNLYIQDIDLNEYIQKAASDIIQQYQSSGKIDNRVTIY